MTLPIICYTASSGNHFISPIMEHLAADHDVKFLDGDQVEWPQPCDLLWIEWCDEAAVQLTNAPKVAPIIIRLHSFEAFTPWVGQVKWSQVDHLVFVAEHVKERVLREYEIKGPEIHVIPNGVDLDRFCPPEPDERAGRKIGWAGGISHKKGPELFAAVVQAVHAHDPSYEFHVAGEYQDARYEEYFKVALPEGVVTFHGQIAPEEMPAFWQSMDYTLSTSPWESFQYAIAEGMACGCTPLVHAWPGADKVYPVCYSWRTPTEVVGHLETTQDQRLALGELGRNFVKQLYDGDKRTADLRALITATLNARPKHQTVACCMIVKGNSARFTAALDSVMPHVDEVCALIDDRHGPFATAIAKERGIRYFPVNPRKYAGCIDFAWSRNWIADKAKSDWVFVLDSDEVIETGPGIKRAVQDAHALEHDAVAVDVQCYTDQGLAEEAKDVRIYRRNGAIKYRYPVHNQLIGQTRVLGTDIRIRSTYVGGLKGKGSRQERSIPPLLKLWDEAGKELDAATTEEERETAQDKRIHAAFFLARMHAASANHEEVIKWAKVLHDMDQHGEFTAPYWRWWSLSEWHSISEEAGWERCDEGLAEWPNHPDLHHIKMAQHFFLWVRACQKGYVGVPMHSRQFLKDGERAAQLLGLPIKGGK